VLQAARSQAEELTGLIDEKRVRDVLDPAIPCLVELCRAVGDDIGRFHLVHDASKTISKHLPTLMALDQLPAVTPGLPPVALPVASITFADSASSSQLQVADWVAGATRQVMQARATGITDPFIEQLAPLVDGWMRGGAWPNPDTIENPRTI
jgi:hypothetical protein